MANPILQFARNRQLSDEDQVQKLGMLAEHCTNAAVRSALRSYGDRLNATIEDENRKYVAFKALAASLPDLSFGAEEEPVLRGVIGHGVKNQRDEIMEETIDQIGDPEVRYKLRQILRETQQNKD